MIATLKSISMKTWLKIAAGLTAVGVGVGLIAAAVIAVYMVRISEDLPSVADLAQYEPPVMTRVHAGDGRLIAEYARESRVFVPIESIPPHVVDAFISAEDKNFYTHGGVDWMGFVRAQMRNGINCVRGGCTRQGGSTITQQVAKNFKLSAEQTIERKAKEWVLAHRLEDAFTKDKILELYLNEIYLGRRAYGVAAASLLYFGKSLDEISLSQVAYLAALPKAPSRLDITRDGVKPRALARRDYVLGRMQANGFITAEEEAEARKEDLVPADRLTGSTYAAADYFVEEVRRRVFSMYGEDELYDGGLSIRTTLDTRLQVAARDALRAGLETYDRRHGYRGPVDVIDPGEGWEERLALVEQPRGMGETWTKAVVRSLTDEVADIGFLDGSTGVLPLSELVWARAAQPDNPDAPLGPEIERPADAVRVGWVVLVEASAGDDAAPDAYALRQIPEVNGALMAMDPHTGRVLALVGGYSYQLSQFNRAVQARRQPGSAFKPFVYAAALDAGYTPVDTILDAPYVSPNPDSGFYKPQNYTGRWYGLSTLRLGVEKSRNAMTVRLANEISLERVSAYGERIGMYDDLPPYEAMSLGAGETTLWRSVTAYAMLVNGGKRVDPTIIDRVQDRTGATIFRHDERDCSACVRESADDLDADLMVARLTGEIVEPDLADPRAQTIDPITAYQITSMLQGVVERGSGTRVRPVGKPVAGKTGTTNDFRDAWFVGFSPDLVAGVYVGFDTPTPLGAGEAGGRVAAPIFRDFMTAALEDRPAVPFRVPPGVRLVPVDATSGALARPGDPGSILEAFRPGTEPTRYAAITAGPGEVDPFTGDTTVGATSTGLAIGGAAWERPVGAQTGAQTGAPGADRPTLRPDPGGETGTAADDDPLASVLARADRIGQPDPTAANAPGANEVVASGFDLDLPDGWVLINNGSGVLTDEGEMLSLEDARVRIARGDGADEELGGLY